MGSWTIWAPGAPAEGSPTFRSLGMMVTRLAWIGGDGEGDEGSQWGRGARPWFCMGSSAVSAPGGPSGARPVFLAVCLVRIFGRVGGGIYTKTADVGADLVGKVRFDIMRL